MQPKKNPPPRPKPDRESYRHGDLRRSLIEAAIALARDGGPDAVVLRETTRRAGVVPNAAYRHFASRDDLLQAVRAASFAALAQAIEDEMARIDPAVGPAERALGSLRAVGTGYLRFAAEETGLFRTGFGIPKVAPDPDMSGRTGLNPLQLLCSALDQMVAAGLLPPERRPGAEYLAWSAVHGLAMLFIEGPLGQLGEAERAEMGRRLVAMVEKGL